MPRYRLHIREGGRLNEDWEGEELSGLDEACAEALAIAREMWAEAIREGIGRDHLDSAVVIADEAGRELAVVPFVDALPPQLRAAAKANES